MLYYKGHKILGVNFLPRYTLAQYTALSVKPHYWIRTDAPFRYSGVVTTLDDLSDIVISNPTDKQVLTYNATSQKWENKDAMGGMLPQIIASTDTGSTVVATKGGTTIPLTETSTGVFECVLYNGSDTYGEWTLTATLNGDTETATVDVDTVKIYNVTFAPPIPDGSTVLPTDDIEILLNCANIWDSPIATLSELLADSTTLATVINDNNAIDYLVRSTAFASGVAGDSNAMTYIGSDNYASDTLLSDNTWCSAICNSAYFESVLNAKVPVMTGNATPEGLCIGDATNGTYNYQAFDGNDSSRCFVLNQIGKVLGYQFTSGCKVKKIYFKPGWNGDTFNVEGSNDGNTWNNIGSIVGNVSDSTAIVDATTSYTYYRTNQSTKVSSSAYQEIYTVQFYGRQDV